MIKAFVQSVNQVESFKSSFEVALIVANLLILVFEYLRISIDYPVKALAGHYFIDSVYSLLYYSN